MSVLEEAAESPGALVLFGVLLGHGGGGAELAPGVHGAGGRRQGEAPASSFGVLWASWDGAGHPLTVCPLLFEAAERERCQRDG